MMPELTSHELKILLVGVLMGGGITLIGYGLLSWIFGGKEEKKCPTIIKVN